MGKLGEDELMVRHRTRLTVRRKENLKVSVFIVLDRDTCSHPFLFSFSLRIGYSRIFVTTMPGPSEGERGKGSDAWLWVHLKPSLIGCGCTGKPSSREPYWASGDALGWLELPGPSTSVASAGGLKGWGVDQLVSRLPLLCIGW